MKAKPPNVPAGTFKCRLCGRTRPVEHKAPGRPPEWDACRGCAAASMRSDDKWKNPLGPTAEVRDGQAQ